MTKSLYGLVGMKHRGTEALVASLPNGEPLMLIREPDNPFDPSAVQVWARGQHVGYVKGSQVPPLASQLDRFAHMTSPAQADAMAPSTAMPGVANARLAIDGGRWPMVETDF